MRRSTVTSQKLSPSVTQKDLNKLEHVLTCTCLTPECPRIVLFRETNKQIYILILSEKNDHKSRLKQKQ